MAFWGRAHVIKAALVAGILLILLNFYNYRFESNPTPLTMVHVSTSQWPKRTRTSSELAHFTRFVVLNNNHTKLNNNNNKNGSISQTNITTHDYLQNTTINNNTFLNNTSIHITLNSSSSNQVILDNKNTKYYKNSSSSFKPLPTMMDKNGQDTTNIVDNLVVHSSKRINEDLVTPTLSGTASNSIDEMHSKNETRSLWDSTTKSNFLQTIMTTLGLNSCPPIPPNLDGPIEVNTTLEPLKAVEERFAALLLPGGWYKPKECNARDRVAIIIPYRDRATHLPIFLANIHPFLMKQQIEYGVFLIEQVTEGLFNRAALMNVGFVEALKLNDWDCFIFHDIDLLPMDDRNLYTCPDQPRHMSVAVDTMGFKLPYSSIFGGVSALTVKQFRAVNGFSNTFWGWGGEDDDMSNRLKHVGFHIARYPVNIARYTMLNHKKEKANPKRYENLVNGAKRYDVEGLNSLKYKVHYMEKKILYTWIVVEVKQDTGS